MLEPYPVRREPRVFLIGLVRRVLQYVVFDPWEVRGLGVLPARVGLRLALTRLIAQTRPSVLVTLSLDERNAGTVRRPGFDGP